MIDVYAELGEGAYWDEAQNALFWVDINKSILFSYVDNQVNKYQIIDNISTVLFVKDDQIFLTNRSGVISYNLASGKVSQISITTVQYDSKEYRANDGIRLSGGVYMYGVMRNSPVKNDGALILSQNGVSNVVYKGVSIPNSFIRIPNTNSLLITDSFDGVVYRMDFDNLWNTVIKKTKWIDLSHEVFTPDGGCISSNGRIFLAMWDGYKIMELNLDGEIVGEYKVPVPRPTNCILNTEEDKLFVTSAYEGLTEYDRQKYPLSGSVLAVDVELC
jgi:sugar lactone lactonase YvrE